MSAHEEFCGCGEYDCSECFGGSDAARPNGNAWIDAAVRAATDTPVAGRIAAHEAGRTLDVLVAERIMGLRVVTVDEECPSETRGAVWHPNAEYYSVGIDCTVPADAPADAEPDHYLASYSTDVRDAMDALAQLGGIVRVTRLKPDEWHVCIGDGHVWWAKTLPLAICRAALASVEVPV